MHINVGNILPRTLAILIDDNPTKATGTITSDNTVPTAGDTVVVNGRTYTFVAALTGAVDEVLIAGTADATMQNLADLINAGRAGVKASGVLTSNETNPTNGQQAVIGAKTYTFKTALTEVKAGGVLTSDHTNPAEGDIVVVGNVSYIFTANLSDWMPNHVLIGATAIVTMANLVLAINGSAGQSVNYGMGTVANPNFTAVHTSDYVVTVSAKIAGVAGNAFAKTETSAHLDWDGSGAVMTGGIASTANEIFIGTTADITLQNLANAVNLGGDGIGSSLATVASTEVTSSAVVAHAITVTAILAGVAGNSLAKTENSANLDWDGAGSVMTGGVSASTVNADVTSANVATHAIILTAITAGLAGNALTLDEVGTHTSKSGATFTGGGSTIGSSVVGGEGGKIYRLSTTAPQLTGTPTYTIQITDSAGVQKYISSAQNENVAVNTALELMLDPRDIIVITTSAKVEETLPFEVNLS